MTASIEIALDALDVERASSFWQAALGYRVLYVREPYTVLGPPAEDTRPRLVIQRVERLATGKTPVHLDLRVDDLEGEVHRLVGLGASIAWEIDETDSGFIRWTTMTDPQGIHFCVCPARDPADGPRER